MRNEDTLKMVERNHNLHKYVAESRNARFLGGVTLGGRVWVPTLTQKDVSDRYQYWNKFSMTKNDFLFQEVVERFTKKAVDKRIIEAGVRPTTTVRNKRAIQRCKSTPNISSVTRPYPSGSCNTILAGKSSTFCIKPIFPLK